jgi:zinc transporter
LEIIASHDGFDELIERLATDLDRVEDRVLIDIITDERQRLGRVRHAAIRLQRPLTGLRRTLRRLHRPDPQSDPPEINTAILAQRLETLEHDLSVVQDRARLMQDEITAKIAAWRIETKRPAVRVGQRFGRSARWYASNLKCTKVVFNAKERYVSGLPS